MNIYVGNLSYKAREAELKTAFEQFGKVASVEIIVDRRTHRSRGYGFIEMPNDREAEAAIKALDGKEFLGRALRVDASQSQGPQHFKDKMSRSRTTGARTGPQAPSTERKKPEEPRGGLLGFFKKLFTS